MSRHESGFTYEDVLSDLEHAKRQIARWEHALIAVQSALEDAGQDNGKAYEIAANALKGLA